MLGPIEHIELISKNQELLDKACVFEGVLVVAVEVVIRNTRFWIWNVL